MSLHVTFTSTAGPVVLIVGSALLAEVVSEGRWRTSLFGSAAAAASFWPLLGSAVSLLGSLCCDAEASSLSAAALLLQSAVVEELGPACSSRSSALLFLRGTVAVPSGTEPLLSTDQTKCAAVAEIVTEERRQHSGSLSKSVVSSTMREVPGWHLSSASSACSASLPYGALSAAWAEGRLGSSSLSQGLITQRPAQSPSLGGFLSHVLLKRALLESTVVEQRLLPVGVQVLLIGELAAASKSAGSSSSQLLQLRPHSQPHVPLLLQAGSADLPALASSHRASARTLTVLKWALAAACAYGLYRAIGPLLGLGGGSSSDSSSSDSSSSDSSSSSSSSSRGSSSSSSRERSRAFSVELQGQDVPDVQCSSSEHAQCCICLINRSVAAYQPCFHVATCMACAVNLCSFERAHSSQLQCPVCRRAVRAISRVYE
jgi:hypothetical protein